MMSDTRVLDFIEDLLEFILDEINVLNLEVIVLGDMLDTTHLLLDQLWNYSLGLFVVDLMEILLHVVDELFEHIVVLVKELFCYLNVMRFQLEKDIVHLLSGTL